jgi:hypothetical protein
MEKESYVYHRLLLLTDDVVIGVFHRRVCTHSQRHDDNNNDEGSHNVEKIGVLMSSDGHYVYIYDPHMQTQTPPHRQSPAQSRTQQTHTSGSIVKLTAYVPTHYEEICRRTLYFRNKYARTKYLCARFYGTDEHATSSSVDGVACVRRLCGNGEVFWCLPTHTHQTSTEADREVFYSSNGSQSMRVCPLGQRIGVCESVAFHDNASGHTTHTHQHTPANRIYEHTRHQSVYTNITCPHTQYQFLCCLQQAQHCKFPTHTSSSSSSSVSAHTHATGGGGGGMIVRTHMTRSVDMHTRPNVHTFQQVIAELAPDVALLVNCAHTSAHTSDADGSSMSLYEDGDNFGGESVYLSSAAFVVLVECVDGCVFAVDINTNELTQKHKETSTQRRILESAHNDQSAHNTLVSNLAEQLCETMQTTHTHSYEMDEIAAEQRLFRVNAWSDEDKGTSDISDDMLSLCGEVYTYKQAATTQSTQFHLKLLLSANYTDSRELDCVDTEVSNDRPALSPVRIAQAHKQRAIRLMHFQENVYQRLSVLRQYILLCVRSEQTNAADNRASPVPTNTFSYFVNATSTAAANSQMLLSGRECGYDSAAVNKLYADTVDRRIDATIAGITGIPLSAHRHAPAPSSSSISSSRLVTIDDKSYLLPQKSHAYTHLHTPRSFLAEYESTADTLHRCLFTDKQPVPSSPSPKPSAQQTHRVETLELENGVRLSAFFDNKGSVDCKNQSHADVVRLRGSFPNRVIIDINCFAEVRVQYDSVLMLVMKCDELYLFNISQVVNVLLPDGSEKTLPLQECLHTCRMDRNLDSSSPQDHRNSVLTMTARQIAEELRTLVSFARYIRTPPQLRAETIYSQRKLSIEAAASILQAYRQKLMVEIQNGRLSPADASRQTEELRVKLGMARLDPPGVYYSTSKLNGAWAAGTGYSH